MTHFPVKHAACCRECRRARQLVRDAATKPEWIEWPVWTVVFLSVVLAAAAGFLLVSPRLG